MRCSRHGWQTAYRDDGNAELKRTFENDVVPFIGDKPVRLVDDSDLRSVLRRVGRERGAGRTAQRMLSELRQLYRWSLSRNPWRTLIRDGNPADLVDPRQVVNDDYEEGIRERVRKARSESFTTSCCAIAWRTSRCLQANATKVCGR